MRQDQLESLVRLVTICEALTDTAMLPEKSRNLLRSSADDVCGQFGIIGIGKTSLPIPAPEPAHDDTQTVVASIMESDKPAVWDETNQRFIDRDEWVA